MSLPNYEMYTSLTFFFKKTCFIKSIYNQLSWLVTRSNLRNYGSGADGIGELGRGAGRGGGGGGKVREAGGALGVRGAVKEEEYFHRMQQQQLEDLKKQLEEQNVENDRRIEELKRNLEKHSVVIEELKDCYAKFKK